MALRRKPKHREAQLAFEALSIEGGLLSPDWLSRAAQLAAGQQSEADYRILKGLNLRDEIGRYWRIAQAHWSDLSAGRAGGADPRLIGTRFVHDLLRDSFGFASMGAVEPATIAERLYPVGFSAMGGRVPVVVAPAGLGLDTLAPGFGDGTRRRSAFGLAQEFLNAEDGSLWGVVSDGVTLRILRDNASLTRPAWIEADLGRIFSEERYADFAALWLLLHETRFGKPDQPVTECALETWRSAGREEGTRAREHLRRGVEEAIVALGQGFVGHQDNQALRAALQDGSLTTTAYFQQLLRLVYRLIFLLTVEERGLLHPESSSEAARKLHAGGYSLKRLRERAVKRSAHDRHADLWEAVKIVFRGVATGEPRLGLPALAGIFAKAQCPHLDGSKLENRALLLAVFRLSWLRESSGLSRVNWRDMGPEELGSVYESLLELVPQLTENARTFGFATGGETKGNARKTSGSYYTPDSLVQVLLDSALEPVVQDTIAKHPGNAVEALLELSIVDPACGSGHFLLAAARRLAGHVARLQANGTPSAAEYRRALRQVVGHCVYGVDLNPMAVELCKVSLWMEAVEPGLPLTFLDSHIQHGNALLGTTPELMAKGIPDAAWEAIEGDDKKTASALKKKNKTAAKVEYDLFGSRPSIDAETQAVARAVAELDAASDANPDALAKKESQWGGILGSAEYRHQKFVADAWCAAFVWPKQPGAQAEAAPTNEVWRQLRDGQGKPSALTAKTTEELAEQYTFFHWHLQFPQVFARGGFDVVLGNPPWIAHAGRAAQPLPAAVKGFYKANFTTFAEYPTTHGMFVAIAARLLRPSGAMGIIIPSSVSELPGYEPTRRAHDELCGITEALVDFGEGQFPGVTQPCMALVSRRTEGGRTDGALGEAWPMERPDLDDVGRALVEQLKAVAPLPRELFGERGFQSDAEAQQHFLESPVPQDRFTLPLREGTDVREFQLLPVRVHADPAPLGNRLRGPDEYLAVGFVVRNTARYPIAALSDGTAFRNSLLAGFGSDEWPAPALIALLNSSLIRWQHYMRFRDARQPVMPQVKIGHLRSVPLPPSCSRDEIRTLAELGTRLSKANGRPSPAYRTELDETVFALYRVGSQGREMVTAWHQKLHESGGRRKAKTAEEET